MFFSLPTRLVSFAFLSLSLPFSLLSTSIKTLKFSRKKESALLLLFFYSFWGSGWPCRNARQVLEMQNFTPAYMRGLSFLRTNVRMIFSEAKFLECIDSEIYLPMELRFAHARTPLWINYRTRTENAPISYFGTFYRPNWQISLPFHTLQLLVKSLRYELGAPFGRSLPV